jgi:hypothetical protein
MATAKKVALVTEAARMSHRGWPLTPARILRYKLE